MSKQFQLKPRLSMAQIWNMSVGFLGIQAGFGLQNGNASAILQRYGADVHELPNFWLVAPIIGMIVQPIIGYYSDRTWTPMGRRKPYFLAGAIAAVFGMLLMPNAGVLTALLPAVLMGAGILMMMDAAFNVSMEPFRALVADKLNAGQRTVGFTVQTALIGIGAVIGSWLPWFLTNVMHVNSVAEGTIIPENVRYSFYIGAVIFIGSILWTLFTTKEYTPEEMKSFGGEDHKIGSPNKTSMWEDFTNMPRTMKQLGLVQFFSWFALFSMWVFTTPAIAHHVYGLAIDDTKSAEFSAAGNWTGIIFGVYNAVSAIAALFLLPRLALHIGRRRTHAFALLCGGLGLISMYFVGSPNALIFSMIGVGVAWASILSMPYAMLAGSIPSHKMGVYIGIFNLFITIPQIISGIINRPIVEHLFGKNAIYAIVMGGVFFILAALATYRVDERAEL